MEEKIAGNGWNSYPMVLVINGQTHHRLGAAQLSRTAI